MPFGQDATQGLESLTPREREVLTLIAEGRSLSEIARRLYRSLKTIESHRLALGRKLGASNRVELAHIAIRAGLVSVPVALSAHADGGSAAAIPWPAMRALDRWLDAALTPPQACGHVLSRAVAAIPPALGLAAAAVIDPDHPGVALAESEPRHTSAMLAHAADPAWIREIRERGVGRSPHDPSAASSTHRRPNILGASIDSGPLASRGVLLVINNDEANPGAPLVTTVRMAASRLGPWLDRHHLHRRARHVARAIQDRHAADDGSAASTAALLEHAAPRGEPLAVLDPDGRYEAANAAWKQVLGRSADALRARPFEAGLTQGSAERWRREREGDAAAPGRCQSLEWLHADGSVIPAVLHVEAVGSPEACRPRSVLALAPLPRQSSPPESMPAADR